eukprot:GHVQ01021348.1.p1 GENE.GHVQ01021348.1~~GHVQ01021348.1.p1  ORF type:complete len:590 (-),score=128.72 GHVQ01021348.1:1138-2826(-)
MSDLWYLLSAIAVVVGLQVHTVISNNHIIRTLQSSPLCTRHHTPHPLPTLTYTPIPHTHSTHTHSTHTLNNSHTPLWLTLCSSIDSLFSWLYYVFPLSLDTSSHTHTQHPSVHTHPSVLDHTPPSPVSHTPFASREDSSLLPPIPPEWRYDSVDPIILSKIDQVHAQHKVVLAQRTDERRPTSPPSSTPNHKNAESLHVQQPHANLKVQEQLDESEDIKIHKTTNSMQSTVHQSKPTQLPPHIHPSQHIDSSETMDSPVPAPAPPRLSSGVDVLSQLLKEMTNQKQQNNINEIKQQPRQSDGASKEGSTDESERMNSRGMDVYEGSRSGEGDQPTSDSALSSDRSLEEEQRVMGGGGVLLDEMIEMIVDGDCEDVSRLIGMRFDEGGAGVVLGVGDGHYSSAILSNWPRSAGLYLVDPYIHLWKGYDDPGNVSDKQHQLTLEILKEKMLTLYPGQHLFVRDFSFSFKKTFDEGGGQPLALVWVDANHNYKNVMRDIQDWWEYLIPGGMLAGTAYGNVPEDQILVKDAVQDFISATDSTIPVHVTSKSSVSSRNLPCWFIIKP